MYVAASIHRRHVRDPTLVGAYKALEMATIDGAEGVPVGRTPSVPWSPANAPTFALFDMTGPEWTHLRPDTGEKPCVQRFGSPRRTRSSSMGRIVMRNREVLTIDEEAVKADVRAAGRDWMNRAGVGVDCKWPVHG